MSISSPSTSATAGGPAPRAGRPRVVTILSVAAVAVAGAIAIAANLGLLSRDDGPAAAGSGVGSLTVSDVAPVPQVVDVGVVTPTVGAAPASTAPVAPVTTVAPPTAAPVSTIAAAPDVQEFAVDVAGSVAVARTSTGTGIRLDEARPAAGWTWTLQQTKAGALTVSFTKGTRTLEFAASLNADGTVQAAVTEPIVRGGAGSGSVSGGGEHEDDHEHEHEGFEGGEDDD